VLDASLEVRSAVVYASVIIVLVFVPVFFLPGLAGTFFKPLALSYILAITASLAVALTLTPALSLMLLKVKPGAHRDALLARGMKAPIAACCRSLPAPVGGDWASCSLAFLGTGWVWQDAAQRGVPAQLQGARFPHALAGEAQHQRRGQQAHHHRRRHRSHEGARRAQSRCAHIGRAEVADEVVGPDFTELWISLDPDAPYDETIHKVQAVVDGYPGLTRDLLTFLRERIKEVLTGASASVVVRIFGPELDQLRTHAAEVGGCSKTSPVSAP
jgi:Cu/Ag efflux pump CusA